MAEGIPFSIAESLIRKLGSFTLQEIELVNSVRNELRRLGDTLSTIKDILLDAEVKQEDGAVGNWVRRLKEVVYDADDLLDDFATEDIRRQVDARGRIVRQVCDFFSHSNQLAFRCKKGHRIKDIKERLDDIANDITKFNFIRRTLDMRVDNREREQTHSFVSESEIIGRENDKEEIVKLLMCSNTNENVSIISIVGIGGLGKTALAEVVYQDERIVKYFEPRMWVRVLEDFDEKLLVEKIKKSATSNELGNFDTFQFQNRFLRNMLDGKRYLLVMDDVWNENFERWDHLRNLLMGGAKGSKILVTTRSNRVALVMGTCSPYVLGGLTDDQSWNLFRRLAFGGGEENVPPNLRSIGKEIIRRCKGVPLAIKTIGRVMRSKTDWLSIEKNEIWRLSRDENGIFPVLKLSYDHLPICLRQCFAYCSLFPKDYIIEKKVLIQLWMAQGYIQPPDDMQQLENIGDQYFEDLLSWSFFQEVKRGEYDNIESCKMHDLIHDLAQSVVGIECSIAKIDADNISERVHHVSFEYDLPDSWEIPRRLLKAKYIRTFFLPVYFGVGNRSIQDTVISNFRCLRVLDLHRSNIEKLQSSIGKLKHLRYLDLSDNPRMKRLPDSISNLCNLQTLNLTGCDDLEELPRDIRKLISLRYLMIDGCDSLSHMPSGLGQLTSLVELPLFVVGVDRHIGALSELNGLNHLRGSIRLSKLQNVTESKDAMLAGKDYLQDLKLEWNSEADNAEILLEGLKPHPNLRGLYIEGYGGARFPSWMMVGITSSLPNLIRIQMRGCKRCQHLPPFGQLPSLRTLFLWEIADVEYILIGGGSAFYPSLKELYLDDLPKLKEWSGEVAAATEIAEQRQLLLPSFPCLSTLRIRHCLKLTSMPLHPYLEELELSDVSENLLQSLMMMAAPENLSISSSLPSSSSSSISSPLSKLKSLDISQVENLVSLPEEGFRNLISLQCLRIRACPNLLCLPGEGFRGLTSLKTLDISSCDSLTSVSQGIQHLIALEELNIESCKDLDFSDVGMQLQGLRSLRSLKVKDIPKLVSLPDVLQHVTTLQNLQISRCNGFMTLPEWIGNLTSLRQLQIFGCPKLTSLPEGMRCLPALQKLEIEGCPLLSERCQKETGEDWPKIAHIPEIYIDE